MDNKQWEAEKKQFNDTSRYKDIMNVPRHASRAHLPMPQIDRAGQFAPFAALTGYKELLDQTAKRYHNKDYLSREELLALTKQIKELSKVRPSPTSTGRTATMNSTPDSWSMLTGNGSVCGFGMETRL